MTTTEKRRATQKRYYDSVRRQETRLEVLTQDHPAGGPVVSVPIRDTHRDGAPVVFVMDFYNMTSQQLSLIQMGGDEVDETIGSWPIRNALKKRGLDPDRYQTFLWDLG